MTADPADLFRQARNQAERSSSLVRAAARLRIARVEFVTDPAAARITLEMALEEISALPEPERTVLFDHAQLFAAAIAPSLLLGIPGESFEPPGHVGFHLGKTMLDHGHLEAALAFTLQERPPAAFPFLFASSLLPQLKNPDQQRAVMRSAFTAWRETHERSFSTPTPQVPKPTPIPTAQTVTGFANAFAAMPNGHTL